MTGILFELMVLVVLLLGVRELWETRKTLSQTYNMLRKLLEQGGFPINIS